MVIVGSMRYKHYLNMMRTISLLKILVQVWTENDEWGNYERLSYINKSDGSIDTVRGEIWNDSLCISGVV